MTLDHPIFTRWPAQYLIGYTVDRRVATQKPLYGCFWPFSEVQQCPLFRRCWG